MKNLTYLILAIFAFGCSAPQQNLPDEFDLGATENGLYTNSYFNLEIPFDPTWSMQDKQDLNKLIEVGRELATGDDQELKAILKASQVNTAYLLTLFKYELGAAVAFNPSLMVIAENVNSFPGIKTGKDYLFHSKKLLKQSPMDYTFDKEVFERTIGERGFHVMEAKLNLMETTITQEYMSTISKGFSLAIVISYTTEEEKNELFQIIDKIKV